MKIIKFLALKDNYIYLIEKDQKAIVIDPTISEPVFEYIQKNDIEIKYIMNTHCHWDHIGGNGELRSLGAKLITSEYDYDYLKADLALADNEEIDLLGFRIKAINSPGHLPGHILLHFLDENICFTGDCLFSIGCGRVNGGNYRDMFESLLKIKNLPDETVLYCGHEYSLKNIEFAKTLINDDFSQYIEKIKNNHNISMPTNILLERRLNPFLKFIDGTEESFEYFKKIRGLKDKF